MINAEDGSFQHSVTIQGSFSVLGVDDLVCFLAVVVDILVIRNSTVPATKNSTEDHYSVDY